MGGHPGVGPVNPDPGPVGRLRPHNGVATGVGTSGRGRRDGPRGVPPSARPRRDVACVVDGLSSRARRLVASAKTAGDATGHCVLRGPVGRPP